MTKRKTDHFILFFVSLCCLVSVVSFRIGQSVSSYSSLLRFDPTTLSITMYPNQKSEETVHLINDSNSTVHFSLFKTSEQLSNQSIAMGHSLLSTENVFAWATYKCNFQRQGFNPYEFSAPPYSLKWTYQGNRPLLSPVLADDSLFVPSEDGAVYRIDARTGIFKSRIDLDEPIIAIHLHSSYLIIVTVDEVVIYDRTSQFFLWRKPVDITGLASVVANEDTVYYLNGSYLISANIATGNENWKLTSQSSQLVYADKKLILSDENKVVAIDSISGKLLWTKEGLELVDLPAEFNGQLFLLHKVGANSVVSSLQPDGSESWKQTIAYPDTNFLAVHRDYVIVTTIEGSIVCLDKKDGRQIWSYDTKSKLHISPALTAHYAYMGTNTGHLNVLDIKTGSLVWQSVVGFPLYQPIAVANGFIYVTDATQNLYAFGMETENVVPPEPPDQVKAIPGDKMSTIFWRHAKQSPDFAGYHIYRKFADELNFSFVATIGIVNQYQDRSLVNNRTYHYVVRSFDTFGNESTNSNMVVVTPKESGDPNWFLFDPTGGMLSPNGNAEIRLQLSTKDLLPGEYLGFLQCIYTMDTQEIEHLSVPLSLHIMEEDQPRLPLPKITSTEVSDTRVHITWEAISSVSEYRLYRSVVKNDELKLIATLPATTTHYVDDTVSNHKTYYYYLQYSTITDQTSDFSVEVSAVPVPMPIQILYPTATLLYEPVFIVSGIADPKARVFYRSIPVTVETDGRFRTTVGINLGKNTLVFYAIDTSGNIQQATLEVQFISSNLKIELEIGSSVVLVNGKTWPFLLEAPPVIRQNRTFVPLRFISEVIGAQVEWTPQDQRIDIIKGSNHIVLWIGKQQAKVNNTTLELESAPFLVNNRTMVPLRFITEPLGAQLQWDPKKQTIQLLFKA